METTSKCLSAAVTLAVRCIGQTATYLALAVLVMVQGCSSSETTATQKRVCKVAGRTASDTPRISIDKTAYDWGDIKPNSTRMAVFHLTNAGGGVLRITDVRKCCGAVVRLEKNELAANESTALAAEFQIGQGIGALGREIILVTNDPESPEMKLTVKGKVIQTLSWAPARFEIAAVKGRVACPEITIRSLENVPFSIKGFAATGQCLTGNFDPSRKATAFRLQTSIDVAKLNTLRSLDGTVRIDLDHPEYKVINVPFSVVPPLQATPAQLLVFNARAGELIVRPVRVQDNQADPNTGTVVQIESVVCKNGTRVELRDVTTDKAQCELKVQLWPVGSTEKESFSVDELVIRMKDGRELTVPVRVFYQTAATSGATAPTSGL